MPVEKGKVIAALDAEYKGKKSLSKHYKDQFAAIAAEAIENDEGIDEYLTAQKPFNALTIAEIDRRASEAVKTRNQELAKVATGEETETKETGDNLQLPEGASEGMKPFMDLLKTLTAEVTGLKQQKQTESIIERFNKEPRLKDVPAFMKELAIPKSEDEFETSVTNLAAKYTQFATDNKLQSFGNDTPGGSVGGNTGKGNKADPATDAAIKQFAAQKVAEFTSTQKN